MKFSVSYDIEEQPSYAADRPFADEGMKERINRRVLITHLNSEFVYISDAQRRNGTTISEATPFCGALHCVSTSLLVQNEVPVGSIAAFPHSAFVGSVQRWIKGTTSDQS